MRRFERGRIATIAVIVASCMMFFSGVSRSGQNCADGGVLFECPGTMTCTGGEGQEGLCSGIVHPPNGLVDLNFSVQDIDFLSTTSPQGRFNQIVAPGGALVQALEGLGVAHNDAETTAAQVRATAQIWTNEGFIVDSLFRGGLFLFIACLDNVDDLGATVVGPISAHVDTLTFSGFPPTVQPGIYPILLSATNGNGRPSSKQLITLNNLSVSDKAVCVPFVVGLQQRTRFDFFVSVEGEVHPSEL